MNKRELLTTTTRPIDAAVEAHAVEAGFVAWFGTTSTSTNTTGPETLRDYMLDAYSDMMLEAFDPFRHAIATLEPGYRRQPMPVTPEEYIFDQLYYGGLLYGEGVGRPLGLWANDNDDK